jgi:hypothetical protein
MDRRLGVKGLFPACGVQPEQHRASLGLQYGGLSASRSGYARQLQLAQSQAVPDLPTAIQDLQSQLRGRRNPA